MKRYIDADDFIETKRNQYCADCDRRKNSKGKFVYEVGEAPCRACEINDMLDSLEDAPTVNVQEVKHGKWSYESRMFSDTIIDGGHIHRRIFEPAVYNKVRICSVCNVIISNANDLLMFYCPHCGAKMDSEL